jgi:hypothetical protein
VDLDPWIRVFNIACGGALVGALLVLIGTYVSMWHRNGSLDAEIHSMLFWLSAAGLSWVMAVGTRDFGKIFFRTPIEFAQFILSVQLELALGRLVNLAAICFLAHAILRHVQGRQDTRKHMLIGAAAFALAGTAAALMTPWEK